eukprot:scaffold28228_cov111-Isochrysis_galbana.AAC.1
MCGHCGHSRSPLCSAKGPLDLFKCLPFGLGHVVLHEGQRECAESSVHEEQQGGAAAGLHRVKGGHHGRQGDGGQEVESEVDEGGQRQGARARVQREDLGDHEPRNWAEPDLIAHHIHHQRRQHRGRPCPTELDAAVSGVRVRQLEAQAKHQQRAEHHRDADRQQRPPAVRVYLEHCEERGEQLGSRHEQRRRSRLPAEADLLEDVVLVVDDGGLAGDLLQQHQAEPSHERSARRAERGPSGQPAALLLDHVDDGGNLELDLLPRRSRTEAGEGRQGPRGGDGPHARRATRNGFLDRVLLSALQQPAWGGRERGHPCENHRGNGKRRQPNLDPGSGGREDHGRPEAKHDPDYDEALLQRDEEATHPRWGHLGDVGGGGMHGEPNAEAIHQAARDDAGRLGARSAHPKDGNDAATPIQRGTEHQLAPPPKPCRGEKGAHRAQQCAHEGGRVQNRVEERRELPVRHLIPEREDGARSAPDVVPEQEAGQGGKQKGHEGSCGQGRSMEGRSIDDRRADRTTHIPTAAIFTVLALGRIDE